MGKFYIRDMFRFEICSGSTDSDGSKTSRQVDQNSSSSLGDWVVLLNRVV